MLIGFETLALSEIVSFTAVHNRRSLAVMERIGMHDAREDFEPPVVPEGSPPRLHCLYRLFRAQWQAMAPVTSKAEAAAGPQGCATPARRSITSSRGSGRLFRSRRRERV
jgi:hypothetical protein